MSWLIYGANGYTGELAARLAVARGERPVLAGRSAQRIGPLAAELGLEQRVFGLDDPVAVRAGLAEVAVVAHCAGPFIATALQMAQACCDTGVHYLDITGEIDVFEQLRGLHNRAAGAGVVVLPGIGFDVVPTDCLAAMVAAALPGASALDLAFLPGSGPSAGTARTALAMLRRGGRARIHGVITPVPVGWKSVLAEFPSGRRKVSAVPWGDVSTAYYSTGIPTITTYTPTPPGGAATAAVLRFGPAAAVADALARRGPRTGCGRPLRRARRGVGQGDRRVQGRHRDPDDAESVRPHRRLAGTGGHQAGRAAGRGRGRRAHAGHRVRIRLRGRAGRGDGRAGADQRLAADSETAWHRVVAMPDGSLRAGLRQPRTVTTLP